MMGGFAPHWLTYFLPPGTIGQEQSLNPRATISPIAAIHAGHKDRHESLNPSHTQSRELLVSQASYGDYRLQVEDWPKARVSA